jgi:CBS domain-containing protein
MITELTVLEAKRFGVFSCSQDCLLSEAARRIIEEDISTLVVVDQEGCLAGIITRTDFLKAWLDSADWGSETVGKFMNPNVVTVGPQTRLSKVAELLLDRQIHRVVVIRDEDGKKRPVSVVSATDLVYHMVNDQ